MTSPWWIASVVSMIVLSGCITAESGNETREPGTPAPPPEPIVVEGHAERNSETDGLPLAATPTQVGEALEFTLPTTTFLLELELDWETATNDFVMVVEAPDGETSRYEGDAARGPEAQLDDPATGDYRVYAEAQGVVLPDNITARADFSYTVMGASAGGAEPVITLRQDGGDWYAEAFLLVEGEPGTDAVLDADTVNGDVMLDGMVDGKSSASIAPWARASSKERAREILDDMHLALYITDGGIVAKIKLGDQRLDDGEGYGGDIDVAAAVRVRGAADSTNGDITATGLWANGFSMGTTNGDITGDVSSWGDLLADTTNGEIALSVEPSSSMHLEADTTNGGIELSLVEADRVGYRIAAETTNGEITESMREASLSGEDDDERTLQTSGFADRSIKVRGTADTTNGSIRFVSA